MLIFMILTDILGEIAIFLWRCIASNATECVTYCENVSSANWFGIKMYDKKREWEISASMKKKLDAVDAAKGMVVYIEMLLNPGWQHRQTASAILRIFHTNAWPQFLSSTANKRPRCKNRRLASIRSNQSLSFRYIRKSC